MTDPRVEEIRARLAKISKEYEAEVDDATGDDDNRTSQCLVLYVGGTDWFAATTEQEGHDVEFIANAPTDIDYLLTKLDEAHERIGTILRVNTEALIAAVERERALIAGVREAYQAFDRIQLRSGASGPGKPWIKINIDTYEAALKALSRLLPSTPTEEPGTVYVVCDRLLDPETNEHCEFDGDVVLDTKRRYRCPGCGRTNYAPDEGKDDGPF